MDVECEGRIEYSDLIRMPSVLERKKCETCGDLCFEVEGVDETLQSSSDEMMCTNEEETCPE